MIEFLLATSPWVYGLKSLVLPGWGQRELGQEGLANAYLAAEAASVAAAATLGWRANALFETSRAWAYQHAGAEPSWGSEYWRQMEVYYDYEEYLEDLWRRARRLYPDDPEAQERWVSEHALEGRWAWDSESSFKYYQDVRAEASFVKRLGFVFLGGVVANHLISAAEAFFSARSGVSVSVSPTPEGFSLRLTKSF